MYEIQIALEEIEANGQSIRIEAGHFSTLSFCVSQYFEACFDFNFPFRPLLAFIGVCIERSGASVEIVLPEYDKFEDFVTGAIAVGDRHMQIYFEHSLAYICFYSDSRQDLEMLRAVTEGHEFRHKGYGLKDGQL